MQLDSPSNPTIGFNQQVQIAYKGNSNWPAFGSTKFLERVAIANRIMMDWAMDSDVLWNSLFAVRTYGPITSTTDQTHDLDSDVFYLSDSVQINRTNGDTANFTVVHPNRRNDSDNQVGMTGADYGFPYVYLSGTAAATGSNLVLNFQDALDTLDVGGTIEVGTYTLPSFLQNATDVIPVDNPMWLVWAVAAELARNDPAKQDQVPNLVGMANQVYAKMITANEGNSFEQPNNPGVYNMNNPGMDAPVYGSA